MIKRICVYCGSSSGNRPEYRQAAIELGHYFAEQNIGLVYGGASVGLMAEVADAVLAGGADAVGVIPSSLVEKEIAHLGLTELYQVDSMHSRKALMEQESDAFIALPGGMGTLDELFEIMTWAQLGFHQKPVGLLNLCGYYDALLAFLQHSVEQGFVKQEHVDMLQVADTPAALVTKLQNYQPRFQTKWIKPTSP